MKKKITIFNFGSCSKCFDEALLLPKDAAYEVERIANPAAWKPVSTDVAVIAGYLLPKDKQIIGPIVKNAKKVVAFGTCAVTGGPFGLASAKGTRFLSIAEAAPGAAEVHGCLGEWFELDQAIKGVQPDKAKLCDACKRRSTCKFLSEVVRQLEPPAEDEESCFNDRGFACNGYVARQCKEKCIDHFTPCRACKPFVDRPGIRMLSMFGTLMANVEVATEATGGIAGTDKLADVADDVTRGVPDVSGLFFRFSLPLEAPLGKAKSAGDVLADVFVGRPVEEMPLIAGMLGGKSAISITLDIFEAYEQGTGIEVSELVKTYRKQLRDLEAQLQAATKASDVARYGSTTDQIRKIAGNMNLSRLFFGGFKAVIPGEQAAFDEYKAKTIEFKDDTYQAGGVTYSLDAAGLVTAFTWRK
jgi:coenzyme F420-reducing hydrogenase gamma subunit